MKSVIVEEEDYNITKRYVDEFNNAFCMVYRIIGSFYKRSNIKNKEIDISEVNFTIKSYLNIHTDDDVSSKTKPPDKIELDIRKRIFDYTLDIRKSSVILKVKSQFNYCGKEQSVELSAKLFRLKDDLIVGIGSI